jgi:hypothetical protein
MLQSILLFNKKIFYKLVIKGTLVLFKNCGPYKKNTHRHNLCEFSSGEETIKGVVGIFD